MPELTRLGSLLIVHAEVPGPIEQDGMFLPVTAARDSQPLDEARQECLSYCSIKRFLLRVRAPPRTKQLS